MADAIAEFYMKPDIKGLRDIFESPTLEPVEDQCLRLKQ
jgi:hypothetical protein